MCACLGAQLLVVGAQLGLGELRRAGRANGVRVAEWPTAADEAAAPGAVVSRHPFGCFPDAHIRWAVDSPSGYELIVSARLRTAIARMEMREGKFNGHLDWMLAGWKEWYETNVVAERRQHSYTRWGREEEGRRMSRPIGLEYNKIVRLAYKLWVLIMFRIGFQ